MFVTVNFMGAIPPNMKKKEEEFSLGGFCQRRYSCSIRSKSPCTSRSKRPSVWKATRWYLANQV
jgi:hypothetical protein